VELHFLGSQTPLKNSLIHEHAFLEHRGHANKVQNINLAAHAYTVQNMNLAVHTYTVQNLCLLVPVLVERGGVEQGVEGLGMAEEGLERLDQKEVENEREEGGESPLFGAIKNPREPLFVEQRSPM
jgi:hypothetical protein